MDVFLDCPTKKEDEAMVVFHARPEKNSLYSKDISGEIAYRLNEPAVFRTFETGLPSRNYKAVTQEKANVLQNILPIFNSLDEVICVIIIEYSEQQKEFFESKKAYPETQIFYESPHRVKSTLENMLEVYGDRQVVLVRELTKIYEEYQRGLISELLEAIGDEPLKGECLLIVDGASEEKAEKSEEELLAEIDFLIETGSQKSKAIKEVAKKYGLNKSDLYSTYHQ